MQHIYWKALKLRSFLAVYVEDSSHYPEFHREGTNIVYRAQSFLLSLKVRPYIPLCRIATWVHLKFGMPRTDLIFLVYSFAFFMHLMASSALQSTKSETWSSYMSPSALLSIILSVLEYCFSPRQLSMPCQYRLNSGHHNILPGGQWFPIWFHCSRLSPKNPSSKLLPR